MAKFITLHIDNANDAVTVNVDLIAKFFRNPGSTYTVVQFEEAKLQFTAKETPEEIMSLVNR